MNTAISTTDDSTWVEKLTVCMTSFGLSCAAFYLSALVLIPLLGSLMQQLNAPALLQQGLIFFLLIGLPIVAALYGIYVGSKIVFANRMGD